MFEVSIHVLTVSDRAHAGHYEDTSGPAAVQMLQATYPTANISSEIIPDGVEAIVTAINSARARNNRIILTLGGTGIAPRDFTPEASQSLITRDLPGIADAIRREGEKTTFRAVMSRGLAGVIDAEPDKGFPLGTILINLAGSPNAAKVGCAVVLPLLEHLVMQLDGDKIHAGH